MDVRDGAILAAASAPAFDPNLFVAGDDEQLASLLSQRSKPMFDRTIHMAIPPGSAFKTLTAIALLESGSVQPRTPFSCRGYLHQPDRQRCEIYCSAGHRARRSDAGRCAGRQLQRLFLSFCRPDGAAAIGGSGRTIRFRAAYGR